MIVSNTVTITVANNSGGGSGNITYTLTLSASPTTIQAGNLVYASGYLTDSLGNAVPNATINVLISYNGSGSCNTPITKNTFTDATGHWVLGFPLSCAGTWTISATYGSTQSIPPSVQVTVTSTSTSNYGLVCSGGYYRCVQGAGNMTLSQCESQSNFGKPC